MRDESTVRAIGWELDLPQTMTDDVGELIMLRQSLVEHGIVRVKELDSVGVVVENIFEIGDGFLKCEQAKVVVIIGIILRVNSDEWKLIEAQPLMTEVFEETIDVGVGDQALCLGFECFTVSHFARVCKFTQTIIGHGAPKKVGEPLGDMVRGGQLG